MHSQSSFIRTFKRPPPILVWQMRGKNFFVHMKIYMIWCGPKFFWTILIQCSIYDTIEMPEIWLRKYYNLNLIDSIEFTIEFTVTRYRKTHQWDIQWFNFIIDLFFIVNKKVNKMNWTCLAMKWRNVFSWLPVRMQTNGTKSKFEGKARTAFTNQCQLRPMLFLWEDGNKLKSISLNGLRCHIRYFKIKVKCRIVEYQSISVHFLHNLIVYWRKLNYVVWNESVP